MNAIEDKVSTFVLIVLIVIAAVCIGFAIKAMLVENTTSKDICLSHGYNGLITIGTKAFCYKETESGLQFFLVPSYKEDA